MKFEEGQSFCVPTHTVIISFMDNKVLYGLLQFSSGAIVRCPFSHFALVSDYFTLFLIELNLVEN